MEPRGEEPDEMAKANGGLTIKSRIWIEDANGKVVFGAGRLKILDEVQRHGSLNAAAKVLQMSYRAVWGKIRATEQRIGHPLLTRKTGGPEGGGSELTDFGKAILEKFRNLQTTTEADADAVFRELFSEEFTQDAGGSRSAKD
jgi:molybdate transport system regulatory protein